MALTIGRLIVKRNLKCLLTYMSCARHESSHVSTQLPCINSTAELNRFLNKPAWFDKYRVLDANWDLDDKDYRKIHLEQRICCSKFFSIEECRDVNSPFPRMLPSAHVFEDYVSELGISNEHHVIIYDNNERFGVYSSPRVWWMFRVFGHENVTVLDGGLKQWVSDGYSTVSGEYDFQEMLPQPKKKFRARFDPSLFRDFEFMEDIVENSSDIQVTDARGGGRFAEGHIKGSISTPFPYIFIKNTRLLKSPDDLRKFLDSKNINLNKELVSSCGSGITAAIMALGIYHATGLNVPIYDGSFSEWKERADSDLIERSS